jgi:uncharacterized protein
MHVIVTGGTGLIGSALVERLQADGHRATRLVRADPTGMDRTWDPAAGRLDPDALAGADAVVHLAGAGIGDHRWTDDYRRTILDSRVRSTELLARTMADVRSPAVLLSGSAIGWYGDRADELLDESSGGGTGFLADVCHQWEAATAPAGAAGLRVVHLRTGIVLSPKGGALKKQLPLFRFGVGGRFGSGRQWQSWISINDETRAIVHLLSADIEGPVNLTAPNPVTNREFADTLARVLRRPAFLPVPKAAPRLVLGKDLADALLFESQRVTPNVLKESQFAFESPELEPALRTLLGR